MENQKLNNLSGVMTPIQNNRRLFTLLYLVLCLVIFACPIFSGRFMDATSIYRRVFRKRYGL